MKQITFLPITFFLGLFASLVMASPGDIELLIKGGLSQFAVDSDFVYFTLVDQGENTISRLDKRTKQVTTLYKGNILFYPSRNAILTDNNNIYLKAYLKDEMKAVLGSISKTTGKFTTLADIGFYSHGFQVEGDFIYWLAEDSIKQVSITDGTVSEVANGVRPGSDLALYQDKLYFFNDITDVGAKLISVPKAGGEIEVIAVDQNGNVGPVAKDNFLIWRSSSNQAPPLQLMQLDTNEIQTAMPYLGHFQGFAIADGMIYAATDINFSYKAFIRAPIRGGKFPEILPGSQMCNFENRGLQLDATHLYFLSCEEGEGMALKRMEK